MNNRNLCYGISTPLGMTESNMVRHIYTHIPFCARICPYCAFYKDLVDRSTDMALLRSGFAGTGRTRPPGAAPSSPIDNLFRRWHAYSAQPRATGTVAAGDFTKSSTCPNWSSGPWKQIQEAFPRARQVF